MAERDVIDVTSAIQHMRPPLDVSLQELQASLETIERGLDQRRVSDRTEHRCTTACQSLVLSVSIEDTF